MNKYMDLMGLRAKDRVTGFTGTVVSIAYDLFGCIQVCLSPSADKDGKVGDSFWADAKRVQVLSKKPVMAVPDFSFSAREIGGVASRPTIR